MVCPIEGCITQPYLSSQSSGRRAHVRSQHPKRDQARRQLSNTWEPCPSRMIDGNAN